MTKNPLLATALAAVSGTMFVMMASAPGAEASIALHQCVSNSRNETVRCCQTVIEDASLLIRNSLVGQSCGTAVRCGVRGSKGRRCYVRLEFHGGGGQPGGNNGPNVPGWPGGGNSGGSGQDRALR